MTINGVALEVLPLPVAVAVRATDANEIEVPPLPAAVEVAAYWIVNEAVTNVVRHAHAQRCELTVTFRPERSAIEVQVCDNGTGLPPAWRPGVGTTSMQERAEELGGSVTISPGTAESGTVVHAVIPLGAQP